MGEFFSKLLELFIKGDKTSLLKIIILCLVIVIIFPVISNYLFSNTRLNQQIQIIKELNNINRDNILDTRVRDYYDTIVESLKNNKPQASQIVIIRDYPKQISDYLKTTNIIKFLSGSIWWILFFIVGVFAKQDSRQAKFSSLIIMLLFIFIFGIVGVYIPTFDPFVINFIGFPMIQICILIIIILLVSKMNKKKNA
jgi:ATP-dependent Zn protease